MESSILVSIHLKFFKPFLSVELFMFSRGLKVLVKSKMVIILQLGCWKFLVQHKK